MTRKDRLRYPHYGRCLRREEEEYWEDLIRESEQTKAEFGEELHEPIVGWWHNDWIGIKKENGAE